MTPYLPAKRLFLLGYYGYGNHGDERLRLHSLALAKQQWPGAEIRELGPQHRWNILALEWELRQADVLLFGGGSLFQDLSSERSLRFYLYCLKHAVKRGKPALLIGQGIGPISNAKLEKELATTLKQNQGASTTPQLALRDKASKDWADKWDIPALLAADLCFLDPYSKASKNSSKSTAHELQPPALWALSPKAEPSEELTTLIQIRNTAVSNKESPAHIVHAHPSQSQNKTAAVNDENNIKKQRIDLDQLWPLPKQSPQDQPPSLNTNPPFSFLITQRYHSAVWAVLNHIPFIAISNDPKLKSIANDYKMPFFEEKSLKMNDLVEKMKEIEEKYEKNKENQDFFDKNGDAEQKNKDQRYRAESNTNSDKQMLKNKENFKKTTKRIKKLSENNKKVIKSNDFVEKLWNSIFSGNKEQALKQIHSLAKKQQPSIALTLNPEMLLNLSHSTLLAPILEKTKLILPDSEGIVWAMRKLKGKLLKKIPGVELTKALCHQKESSLYIIGSTEKTLADLANTLPNTTPILGMHHGYFPAEQPPEALVNKLKSAAPDIILIAMGVPKQEQLALYLSKTLNKGLIMGVGGSIDIVSGRKHRAPKWMISCKCEWLYRSLTEPQRIKKWPLLLRFFWRVWSRS